MSIEDRVKEIKGLRDADLPEWSNLVKEYDKSKHAVHTQKKFDASYKNIIIVDSGVQKLMCDRMVQMMNTIPIERVYDISDEDSEVYEEAKNIIEAVYFDNKINTENNYRLHAYFASAEAATVWTGIPQTHDRYGRESDTRLKCMSMSPMERKYSRLNQAQFHPQFDAFEHLTGFGYSGVWSDGTEYAFFYTSETIEEYVKRKDDKRWVGLYEDGEHEGVGAVRQGRRENKVGKIPISYMYRMAPLYAGQTGNVDAIETIESSQAQVVKRNSAPVMVVKDERDSDTEISEGERRERERKTGVAREIYAVKGDGDVYFVDIPSAHEAAEKTMSRINQLIEKESQLPLNLTLDNLRSFGNVSGEALKQVLMGAHLKVGQEQGEVIEFLDREMRVVKHLLTKAYADDTKLVEAIENIKVEHKITPFSMDDETASLERTIMRLNVGLTSLKEVLRNEGVAEPEKVIDEWIEEQREQQAASNEYSAMGSFLGTLE